MHHLSPDDETDPWHSNQGLRGTSKAWMALLNLDQVGHPFNGGEADH